MCGISGLISSSPVLQRIMFSLERLEYRGYDSAGVLTIEADGFHRIRSVGPLGELKKRLLPLEGTIGIGHTRWATHGAPHETNAHPHISQGVAVVHNGIIENFVTLKDQLLEKGFQFESETDTEVIAHLISYFYHQTKDIKQTFLKVFPQLQGNFAIVCVLEDHSDCLIVARQGTSPLAIGYREQDIAVSSDAMGLVGMAETISYLEQDQWGILRPQGCEIYDMQGNEVVLDVLSNPILPLEIERGDFQHYMLKEIHEQPTLIQRLNQQKDHFDLKNLDDFSEITFLGCGTAFYAGYMGKLYWEKLLQRPIGLELASEFHYRFPPLKKKGLFIALSQSGETADTLKAVEYAKSRGQTIVAVVNVPQSSLTRLADHVFYTQAGPEIGVASTKAFITQIWTLLTLAAKLAHRFDILEEMDGIPWLMEKTFLLTPRIQEIARHLSLDRDILFLGRGLNYPIALEGALKMKELTYAHAEAMPAGELKHGPLALIDSSMPVVMLMPHDQIFEKTFSNLHEVCARRARVIAITDQEGAMKIRSVETSEILILPSAPEMIHPFVSTLVVQMLSYYTAFYKGVSIDCPRNLAKCVTVE
jgi:glutamine---fructose-6-phosphate transaminase (isomerizing)